MVRRMRVKKDKSSKLIRLGRDSLKYKFVENSNTNASGYRVMNLDLLKEEIVKISEHSCMCEQAQRLVTEGKDPITIKGELSRSGLYSVILVVCKGCDEQFPIKTSEKQANGLYDINVRAVWGSVTSGGGASNLNEMLGSMSIPPMHEHMFTVLEDKIGSWWENVLKDEMEKAGAEEKRIAIEKGNFHEGLPAITVICDGGWSKRTHKHTYDANGRVAVIFGAATNKLLYIGIRNKLCCICRRAENEGTTPQTHKCHANWKESSQAMEADIILSGFLEAETSHGVRYLNIIADGDSSVYTTLLENVPVWGKDIKKLECANHICKCVIANLEKLVEEKPQYKGKGKLTKLNRIRLATAIRCAIKMRSKTKDHKQLRRDIINSIYHILGFHKHCSDFCQKRPSNLPIDTTDDNNDNNIDDSSFDAIFEDQISMWKIPDDKELENSRLAGKNHCTLSEIKELITDVQIILNRVAEKSDRLIGNFTTNLAESWMAIRSKFDGGKVINRCSRGSWYTRCYGGALRKNLGTTWSPVTFQTVTNVQAGVYFNKLAKKQDMKLRHAKKYKEKPESKLLKRKRKLQSLKVGSTKKIGRAVR